MSYNLTRNVKIDWKLGRNANTGEAHVVRFYVINTTSGTFTLWINGEETAAITLSDTLATVATNIETAMEAVTGGSWSSSVSGIEITLTYGTVDVGFKILLGSVSTVGTVRMYTQQYGTQRYSLTSKAINYKHMEATETQDKTPVLQFEEQTMATKSTLTFSFSAFAVEASVIKGFYPGAEGVLTVYENQGVPGTRWFSFPALIESVGVDLSVGAIEVNVSGRRNGRMIAPVGSTVE